MFKPLLRVLPSLSGNVKLACNLTDLNKIGKTNRFDSHIRYARLLPLSSNLAQRKVEANLLNSSYETDLSKYYKHYSNYFFSTTFEYNKIDYPVLDKSSYQLNRDTDFEFGCKRISYEKNKYQFAFFAPIYIESQEDIPDYFLINIKLSNELYHTEKQIKVNIKDDYKYNYLYVYLKKYSASLDGKVIYCLPNLNQATYYGIDLKKGSFTKVVDSIIAKNYHYQKTINAFDANICNGFERNNIAIRQVIPFCFYFNINEILTKDELKKFANSEANITGTWFKDSKEVPFYNFDTNYDYLYENVYSIDKKTGLFDWYSTGVNLLDVSYPSLNEGKYINYRYSNKIQVPSYNRWKLKYSDDKNPYITNLSSAFSFNQSSIYKYGYFPEIFDSVPLITDKDNNAILPIGNSIEAKDSPYTNNYPLINKYYDILNSGVANWYKIYSEIDDTIFSDNIWKTIDENKVFYNGILYDLSTIYDTDKSLQKIDKFSIILCPHFNTISQEDLPNIKRASNTIYTNDKYITDRNTFLTEGVIDSIYDNEVSFNNLQSFYKVSQTFNNGNSQLVYDNLYIQDNDGDFLDLIQAGFNQYDLNIYYKAEDIYELFLKNGYTLEDIPNNVLDRGITGLEFIPAHRLSNLLHENGKDILFEGKKDSFWILQNLYFSNKGNRFKTLYNKEALEELIKENNNSINNIPFYIKQTFISRRVLSEAGLTNYDSYLTKYYYYPTAKDVDGKSFINNVFIKEEVEGGRNFGEKTYLSYVQNNTDIDFIYVDPYNLRNVIQRYNSLYRKSYPYAYNSTVIDGNFFNKSSFLYKEFYAKFLNINHLSWYVTDIHRNENNEEDIHPYDTLYIKRRTITNNPNTLKLDTLDLYIPIKSLYDNHRLLTQDEKLTILNSGRGNIRVFKKESDIYSQNSYREILVFDSQNDYHEETFYYIPDFYYQESANYYIKLDEYIKSQLDDTDIEILRFINPTTISIIKNYDDSIIDVDYVDSYVIRKSMDSLEMSNMSFENKETMDNLKKAIRIIKSYASKLKNNIYYKDYLTGRYVKYPYYTGENDFFALDSNLKKAIFNDELDIDTYIINEKGKYVRKSFKEGDYYTLETEDTSYKTKVVNEFISDLDYHIDDNYYTFSNHYTESHDIDKIVDILDLDGEKLSSFSFEVVYKKKFLRMNKTLFDFINLTEDETYPYKDLYLYRLYMTDEYPAEIKYYYQNIETSFIDSYSIKEPLNSCLYPLFNDIYLENKDYTVVYTDYKQKNIYSVKVYRNESTVVDEFYRYNSGEVPYMLDISDIKDKLPSSFNKYRYREINKCKNSLSCIYDDLNLYDKYKLNTKVSEDETVYGFILFDIDLNNTVMSFNIMNRRYIRNKYFISINSHDIYNNYDFDKVFNILLPFMKLNLVSFLYNNVKFIVKPSTLSFNTNYKQLPLRKENGETYAYDILYHEHPLDTISLQRYFDSIVPLIKQENIIRDVYSLKYKDNDIPRVVSYTNDVFYSENLNIWEYSPMKIYNEDNSYYEYTPLEYKYFNDNRLINLEESISIPVCKEEVYDKILEYEKDDFVFRKFKTYILNKRRVSYNDDEILFLINKYNIEYDSCCVGLNTEKTDKIYSLTYKFNLK